jgi:two-component system, OmpR family, response regulator
MRAFVVEDEIKMAGLIRRGLREEGYSADVAIKGEDALWMAQATDYDAIVLDVMLPGLDGLGTCRRLRESGRLVARADAHGARRGGGSRRRP